MTAARAPRRPLGGLSPIARRRVLCGLTCAGVGTLIPLIALEREMTRTGGPGIIPFELAGTTERAERIMQRWGHAGAAAARRSLILDHPFLVAYASLHAIACNAASDSMRRRRLSVLAAAGAPLAWGHLAAGGFNAIENAALLAILAGHGGHRRAAGGALVDRDHAFGKPHRQHRAGGRHSCCARPDHSDALLVQVRLPFAQGAHEVDGSALLRVDRYAPLARPADDMNRPADLRPRHLSDDPRVADPPVADNHRH